jgi:hypothetical protein
MLGQSVLDMCSARTTKGDSACSLLLGAHRQGHAIPLSVSGAEVGGGETAYTFRQVDLKEDFLLFMSDTLVITAASQETLTMMGVRPRPRMCASHGASSVLVVVVLATAAVVAVLLTLLLYANELHFQ